MAVVVVYGGGFQPFHAGHLSGYIEAKQAFPNADFYVAASNDTKTRPIPFDDKKFLAQQAGVTDNFAEVKLPIRPTEILDRYNPNKDIFILVRSERDPVAYTKKDGSPGYYQPYVDINKCEPMGQHGYVFVTHKKDFKLNGQTVYSGTQVRDMYANSDDRGRINIINQLYPRSSQQDTIKKMLDKYIGTVTEPVEKPVKGAIKKLKADKLKEHIQRMRPLLREANSEQKLKLLKLMKVALKEHDMVEGLPSTFSKRPETYREPCWSYGEISQKLGITPNELTGLRSHFGFPEKIDGIKSHSGSKAYFRRSDVKRWVNDNDIINIIKSNQNVTSGQVDEAKIHFTDPSTKVNLYYIPPKLEAQGQVQNVAHNIPYSTVEPLIGRLLQKYTNMNPDYIVWYAVDKDKYGQRLEEQGVAESNDYLEEK